MALEQITQKLNRKFSHDHRNRDRLCSLDDLPHVQELPLQKQPRQNAQKIQIFSPLTD